MKVLVNQNEAFCKKCNAVGNIIMNHGAIHCSMCGCNELISIKNKKEFIPRFKTLEK